MVRYSKKHGRCCPGHNVIYLTCQSGSLGSFSRKVGLAKQRTDFSVRTRPSFEFFIAAWRVLWASVLLLAVAAENKRWLLEAGGPGWEATWIGPSGVCLCRGFLLRDTPGLPQGHEHLCFVLLYLGVFEKLQLSGGAGWVKVVLLSLWGSARYNKVFEAWGG